jgi:uncharacterized protein YggT (Ycf19 family)
MRSHLVHTDSLSDPGSARLGRVAFVARVAQVVDFLFGVLYTAFLVRLALEFFGARPAAGFVQFIRSVTDYFYGPFRGIFATTTIEGGHIVWPLVVALLAYILLHAVIRGLLGLIARA